MKVFVTLFVFTAGLLVSLFAHADLAVFTDGRVLRV
jgi:hypothetical protein